MATPGKRGTLFYRVKCGRASSVLRELERGLEANGVSDANERTNGLQQNLMFAAAARLEAHGGSKELAVRLAALGVHPASLDRLGQTPLFYAAREGNDACARYLVEARCQVNAVDKNGQTPIFFAVWAGRAGTCKTLQELGAKTDITDRKGEPPGAYAPPSAATRRLLAGLGVVCTNGNHLDAATAPQNDNLVPMEHDVAVKHPPGPRKTPGKRRRLADALPEMTDWDYAESSCSALSSATSTSSKVDLAEQMIEEVVEGRYAVVRPSQHDALVLRRLENAFVLDQRSLFDEEVWAPNVPLSDWYSLLGVGDLDDRAILVIQGAMQAKTKLTLACICRPEASTKETEESTGSSPPSAIVGYVHFDMRPAHIQIHYLMVDNSHRARGLGALLLAGMVSHAVRTGHGKACHDLRLVAIARNRRALRLYEALGFVEQSRWCRQLGPKTRVGVPTIDESRAGAEVEWKSMSKVGTPPHAVIDEFRERCSERLLRWGLGAHGGSQ